MDIRENIIKFFSENDYSWTTSGNISFKVDNKIYVTKSGTDLKNLKKSDFVIWDNINGKPTKERLMHKVIYDNSNAKFAAHLSPVFTTIFSATERKLKRNISIESTYLLKDFTTINFYRPGTKELAKAIEKKSKVANVILMKNHGCMIFDNDIKKLFDTIEILEVTCKANIICNELHEINKEDVDWITTSNKYKSERNLWRD